MKTIVVIAVLLLAAVAAAERPAEAAGGLREACPARPAPFAHCLARYRLNATKAPTGLDADDIRSAYGLPRDAGAGQTIGIVDAYDDPKAEHDLAIYRAHNGLPPCTTDNGCFRKVNQRGDPTPLPEPDAGWSVEISLDLDMASAACPKCRILLVEADAPTLEGLGAAVDTAVSLGADVVSNSYGAREFAGQAHYARHYDQPGHAITVSSGDAGFTAASFPANLSSVVAVGGTTLRRAPGTGRGWTERAWRYGGSSCSAYVAKPRWQRDRHCDTRTIADVAAVADNLAVYDSYRLPGWITVGGTSASAPIVAGVIGLAGNADRVGPAYPYRHRTHLYDVTSGANDPSGTGAKCGHDYLCTARPGYDAPTGLGTPHGIGAF